MVPESRKRPQERPITNRSGQQYPGEIAAGGHATPGGLPGAKTRHEYGLYASQHPIRPKDWMREMATNLGIEVEGKSDDELLDEIRLHTPIAEK